MSFIDIPWLEGVMSEVWRDRPDLRAHIDTAAYNRIYEAVARGTEQQGRALVRAIIDCMDKALRATRQAGEGKA